MLKELKVIQIMEAGKVFVLMATAILLGLVDPGLANDEKKPGKSRFPIF